MTGRQQWSGKKQCVWYRRINTTYYNRAAPILRLTEAGPSITLSITGKSPKLQITKLQKHMDLRPYAPAFRI